MVGEDKTEMRALLLIASIASGLVCAQTGLAQDAKGLSIDVADCVKLQAPEKRLACYEERVRAAQERNGEDAARPLSQTDNAEADRNAASRRAETARDAVPTVNRKATDIKTVQAEPVTPAPRAREKSSASSAETESGREFFGTIAALQERVPNEYVITLDDGQVWRQMRSQRYPLHVGDSVRIYPTRWGKAYRLTAEKAHGFTQVERVR